VEVERTLRSIAGLEGAEGAEGGGADADQRMQQIVHLLSPQKELRVREAALEVYLRRTYV
jgi:hypothetical protein